MASIEGADRLTRINEDTMEGHLVFNESNGKYTTRQIRIIAP